MGKSKKGSVIMMTVFIIFFGAMLFFALEMLHRSDLETATNQILDLQALYCADSGVERAIIALQKKSGFPNAAQSDGITPVSQWFGGNGAVQDCTSQSPAATIGTFTVYIWKSKIDSNYTPMDYNRFVVTSCGTVGNFKRAIAAEIRRSHIHTTDPDVPGDNKIYIHVLSWQETSSTKCN